MAVLWLLRSLLRTEVDVLVIVQVPVISALVLCKLCECRHKSLLKTRFFWIHFCRRQYRSIFNHSDVISPQTKAQTYRILWNNAKGLLRRSMSIKVTDFVTNGKPICNFLSVINTNLHPISRHFEVIADYCSNLVRKTVTLRFWAPPLGV